MNHIFGSLMVSLTDEIANNSPKISEMRDYHAYGKVIFTDVLYHAATPGFTGKELDNEGLSTKNMDTDLGVRGLRLNYFGKRYYDSEVGVWTAIDIEGQFYNPYSYSVNPLNTIDPEGAWVWGVFKLKKGETRSWDPLLVKGEDGKLTAEVKVEHKGNTIVREKFYYHEGSVSDGCVTVQSEVGSGQPGYPYNEDFVNSLTMLNNTSTKKIDGQEILGVINVTK